MLALVTGVAGFIGSTLAEKLINQGYKVRGIDCFLDYYPRELKQKNLQILLSHSNFEFVEANLNDTDLDKLLNSCEYIFHQAAQAGVRASWGQYFKTYSDNNVLATQRLLDAARRQPKIKKIVYGSSSSIYGEAEKFPTLESALPKPVSPYGVTKLAAEHLMNLYASQFGLPTVSLRYFTVYGPRQRPDMAFNRFIHWAVKGKEIEIYGDGNQSRDFTFIDDIVDANILAAKHGKPGSVYNIGGGTQATINQVLDILRQHLGSLNAVYKERQVGDAMHTGADTKKARLELSFLPKVKLEDGIAREIAWVQSNSR
jgi:UDP-glucuronate 4-epimerase